MGGNSVNSCGIPARFFLLQLCAWDSSPAIVHRMVSNTVEKRGELTIALEECASEDEILGMRKCTGTFCTDMWQAGF